MKWIHKFCIHDNLLTKHVARESGRDRERYEKMYPLMDGEGDIHHKEMDESLQSCTLPISNNTKFVEITVQQIMEIEILGMEPFPQINGNQH